MGRLNFQVLIVGYISPYFAILAILSCFLVSYLALATPGVYINFG